MSRVDAAASSDTGLVRENNEDSTLCVELDGGQWLLAVADGVGGIDGGEVASTAVVSELAAYVTHLRETGEADAETLLRAGYARARAEFAAYAVSEGYARAGTTLVAAVVDADEPTPTASVLSVGDSRAYLFDGDNLRQVTTDHTLAREGLSTGTSTDATGGHVLSRWVGVEDEAGPDVFAERLTDTLLLCSDGLTNELSDAEIRSVLAADANSSTRVEALIERALAHGGRDNVSVVVASIRT